MTYPQGKLKMWKKMKQSSSADQVIQKAIYDHPDIVVRILNDNGYRVSNKPTLDEITEKTFKAIYIDANKKFADSFDSLIQTGEYSNVVVMATIAVVGSIVSGILGSSQARKMRALQTRIAVANIENNKLLAEEQLRVQGETARTEILANTLLAYRTSLQGESTARQKNVYIYLIAIGLGISIIYGTNLLLSE